MVKAVKWIGVGRTISWPIEMFV